MVGRATNPRAISPALEASMTSPAACRAMASAMGLRQELPRHRNRTFTRLGSDLIIRLVNDRVSLGACGKNVFQVGTTSLAARRLARTASADPIILRNYACTVVSSVSSG